MLKLGPEGQNLPRVPEILQRSWEKSLPALFKRSHFGDFLITHTLTTDQKVTDYLTSFASVIAALRKLEYVSTVKFSLLPNSIGLMAVKDLDSPDWSTFQAIIMSLRLPDNHPDIQKETKRETKVITTTTLQPRPHVVNHMDLAIKSAIHSTWSSGE